MTYSATYCALISKRLRNPITKADCYVEQHHIIPKSEGGLDEPDNLVNLTAREHYIAHLLLAKIYNDAKMYSAVMYMMTGFHKNRKFKFNSRVYKRMREDYSQRASVERKGINKGSANGMYGKSSWDFQTEEGREIRRMKASVSNLGEKNHNYGKKLSAEIRAKMSKSMIGNTNSKGKHIGKHWYNDGTRNVFKKDCPEGFVAGRLPLKRFQEEVTE